MFLIPRVRLPESNTPTDMCQRSIPLDITKKRKKKKEEKKNNQGYNRKCVPTDTTSLL
jgi:hypothetical protein